jgi:hypothetical protein
MKWEEIDRYHMRAKVFGGWLVKSTSPVVHNFTADGRGMESGWDFRETMAFVPDPNHEWKLEASA